jgi:hypothetical protein
VNQPTSRPSREAVPTEAPPRACSEFAYPSLMADCGESAARDGFDADIDHLFGVTREVARAIVDMDEQGGR